MGKLAEPVLSRRLVSELTFVALDTETTGLGEAYLVEVAAVRFKAGEVLDEFSALINPGMPIPPYVTGIHGITDAMVADSPRAREVLPQFFKFLDGSILVAHNACFDVKILAVELYRSGLPIPQHEALDTFRIARRVLASLPNHRLATLAYCLGLSTTPSHRALADARAVVGVFEHCLESLRSPLVLERVLNVNGRPYSFRQAVESSRVIAQGLYQDLKFAR